MRTAKLPAVLLSMLLGAVTLAAGPPQPAGAASRPSGTADKMVADYDLEIREQEPRADGIRHVDTPATIAKLREAHVTDYFYLVWHAPTDWADLKGEFLPAAEKAGIDVWVYVVPPSECNPNARCSFPYMTDYVRWAKEIAKLSLKHPNLTGWAMDDFQGPGNLDKFTPEYVSSMRDAEQAINPDLQFFPVLYPDDYSADFLGAYGEYFDGAILPYTSDFESFDGVDEELDRVASVLAPYDMKLVLMIYATKISTGEYPPSAEYIAGALRVGLDYMMRGDILGVTTYALAKEFQQEPCGPAYHLDLTVPSYTPTSPGDFVSASQTVQVDPDASSYGLRFLQQDSYPVGTAGYHFKQLLVDGQIVWDRDVASDAALSWDEQVLDLTPYLQGKSEATITFRLYDRKGVSNFGVRASFAELEASGFTVSNPDFSEEAGWTFETQGPGSARYANKPCDPDRQRHSFEAVRDLYGPYALNVRAEDADATPRVRKSLLEQADRVLAHYRKSEYLQAAGAADELARQAAAAGLTVLAAQSRAVAEDLRREA